MAARIDPLARVSDGARLADDVEVGPFCTVGENVELRAGVRLISHVNIAGHTVIGERTIVHPFASLGGPPQSLGSRGEPTRLAVGTDCIIRESATMNLGTAEGIGLTTIGDRGYFMAYSHVGHDCIVGHDVIFANCATLGGHCVIGDNVFIGGLSAVHQFSEIGSNAMIGGVSGVRGDVIPFGVVAGGFASLSGINTVGMKRRKFPLDAVRAARKAYRMLFLGDGMLAERLAAVDAEFPDTPAVAEIVAFIRKERKRPLCQPSRQGED